MRTTQRLTLTASLALALTTSFAFAQQAQQTAPPQDGGQAYHHHHHTRDPHKQAMKMSQRLNLSPDQTARVEPILAARQQKLEALKADTSLSPDAKRAQFHAIHEQTKQQLAEVLTPAQQEQMKAMHHNHGARGQSQAEQPPTA